MCFIECTFFLCMVTISVPTLREFNFKLTVMFSIWSFKIRNWVNIWYWQAVLGESCLGEHIKHVWRTSLMSLKHDEPDTSCQYQIWILFIIYFTHNVLLSLPTDRTIHISPVHPLYLVSRICLGLLMDDKVVYKKDLGHKVHINLRMLFTAFHIPRDPNIRMAA